MNLFTMNPNLFFLFIFFFWRGGDGGGAKVSDFFTKNPNLNK